MRSVLHQESSCEAEGRLGPCPPAGCSMKQPSSTFRAVIMPSSHAQGPGISMELSRDSGYDEVCAALAERLRAEGQAEALQLEDPQQLRFTGQQSWTATIPKTAPFKWRQWDALHQVRSPSAAAHSAQKPVAAALQWAAVPFE